MDKGVNSVAVGRDSGFDETTFFVIEERWLHHGTRAAPHCLRESVFNIVNVEGDVFNAVAVNADMFGHRAIGRERAGKNQSNVVLLQHERGAIALACFE